MDPNRREVYTAARLEQTGYVSRKRCLNVNVEFLIQSGRENWRSCSRAAQVYKRAGPGSEIMALDF